MFCTHRGLMAVAFLACTQPCTAQDVGVSVLKDLKRFERIDGMSQTDYNVLEAQKPAIRLNAPPSEAAERAVANFDSRMHPKIVGGVPIAYDKAPWQAGLIFASGPEPARVQFCGGSLIAANWVITAAHCVDQGTKPGDVDIILGTAFYKHFGERLKVKALHVHEQWDQSTMQNDIALVELAASAQQGTIVPMAPPDAVIADGTAVQVTGWGALSEGGLGSEILMGADIPIVPTNICNSGVSYGGRITPGMMCAGERNGGLDSCQGDSGGPAVAQTLDGKFILVGIVSWGTGCARRDKYGVYTRVTMYRSWIDAKMKP